MQQQLISRSPDLQRLRDEGYHVAVVEGHLLIRDVPYVTSAKTIARGTIVTALTLAGNVTTRPTDHVAHFMGEQPCSREGEPLTKIMHPNMGTQLAVGLFVNHMLSSKPAAGYPDYYEKMTTYVRLIAGPAEALDPTATACTFPPIEAQERESVFHYIDTASSRARISTVSDKLAGGRIAIVGLGGTGAYVLDLVAKTPVGEIHLFDGDVFSQHNAFRSPGAASLAALQAKPDKVTYFAELYSHMHRHIIPHREYVTGTNLGQLGEMSFVFLCLDKGSAKQVIVQHLETAGIPFVDVGMGVYHNVQANALGGIVRVTTSTAQQRTHVYAGQRISFGDADGGNEYQQNIQIADLNALNAALAVVKWKKQAGFYLDLEREFHSTYTIDGNILQNEDQLG
ncbi:MULTISPECIES: ThiF family adenylyltransferase [Hymenobacter]|uniref:ThiF family adenylyltransferase n=1 Tax=Hymenobacter metallilatus TaxID=2493666 RepID=A0A428IXX2_9BACT|nr:MULTISPECIES: ThiF family adenylyltransferase [Hymenobacter]RSK23857.1 ThiF family adenylyltransferase [Hymenobacter metallilatus]